MAVSNVELRVNATQAVTALKNVDGQAKKFNTTISELRTQLTEEELIFFAGYYELKYDREKKEADAIKRKSRYS